MNDDNVDGTAADRTPRRRTIAVAAAVGVAGVLAGGLAVGALSSAWAETRSADSAGQQADPSRPVRSDEKLLTGETRTKVLAAVEERYPDATVVRVETDSGGVYEAHIVEAGQPLTVLVGEDFEITGTQSGPGGHGGPGGRDGGPGEPPDEGATDSSYRQS